MVRKVYELEGQDMDEDEEEEMAAESEEAGSGLALRPDGFAEGREEEV